MTLQRDNYERQRGEGPALDRYRAEQRRKYDGLTWEDIAEMDRKQDMTSQPAPQEALAPCPWCKNTDIFRSAIHSDAEYIYMGCRCGARGPTQEVYESGTREEAHSAAISAWNHRPAPPDSALREALVELMRCAQRFQSVATFHSKYWERDMQLGAATTQADTALAAVPPAEDHTP